MKRGDNIDRLMLLKSGSINVFVPHFEDKNNQTALISTLITEQDQSLENSQPRSKAAQEMLKRRKTMNTSYLKKNVSDEGSEVVSFLGDQKEQHFLLDTLNPGSCFAAYSCFDEDMQ